MGNYRFRLSDMIPNSWFYKLKYLRRHKATKKKQASSSPSSSSQLSHWSMAEPNHSSRIPKQPHLSDQRKSYHFTRDLAFHPNSPSATRFSDKHSPVEPPRKSSRRRRSTRRYRPPSRLVSAGCSCRATVGSVWTDRSYSPPEECPNSSLRDDQASSSERDSVLPECGSERGQTTDGTLSSSTCCECKAKNDVVIEMDDDKLLDGDFDGTSELDRLPPIITRKDVPTKIQRTSAEFSERNTYGSLRVKVLKEDFSSNGACHGKDERKAAASPARRWSANSSSPGLKLRTNSPRIVKRRIQAGRKSGSSNSSSGSRRSVSESFAVVKSSKDPRRDFRESMVEMIVENNIRASKDLEELLACYLSLNSDEYHDLIINVFKQIWFDFVIHLRLK